MNPLAGMALVLAALGALMSGTRWIAPRAGWSAELSRKAVHIGMGLICLSFPWLFRTSAPVLALGALAPLALGAVRVVPPLRARLGGVLGGVGRDSWGDLLFAPAVAFVFWLSEGDPLRYGVPVLVLALADAAGALVGRRFGSARYDTDDGQKSVEGSSAFFAIAFLVVGLPLWISLPDAHVEALLIALLAGLLLMLVEAVAWHGLDNLLVPLSAYLCVTRLPRLGVDELAARLAVLLALLLVTRVARRATRITPAAGVAAALVLFVTGAVGGVRWLAAPLALLAGYALLCRAPTRHPRAHTVRTVAWIGVTGLIWMSVGGLAAWYAACVAYAAHLAMIALAYFADRRIGLHLVPAWAISTVFGCALVMPPCLALVTTPGMRLPGLAGAGLAAAAAAGAFAAWQPALRDCPSDEARWLRQGGLGLLASIAAHFFARWMLHA